MNSLTLGFSRTISSYTEQMEDLSFQKGDFYNIYIHACTPADIEGNNELLEKFSAFRIKSIADDYIEIESLYSREDISLKLGETKELDFKRLGVYSLTLKKLW